MVWGRYLSGWAILAAAVVSLAACNGGSRAADDSGTDPLLIEGTQALCSDGTDNDDDGFTDCDDQDCWDFVHCATDGGVVGDSQPPPDATVSLAGCSASCASDEVCIDGQCAPVGPPADTCGDDRYGDLTSLPQNDGIVYVDGSHAGQGDGSADRPFKTISEALAKIPAGQHYTVAVAAGVYDEPLSIGRRLDDNGEEVAFGADLYCRCAEMVKIAATVRLTPAATASRLEARIDGCSISPAGFDLEQATDWSCAASSVGIEAVGGLGGETAFHVLLRDSLVAGWCTGVYFSSNDDPVIDSSLCVVRSRIGGNTSGIVAKNAPMNFLGSPFPACQQTGTKENLSLLRSRLDHNRDHAVYSHMQARGIALHWNIIEHSGRLGGRVDGEGLGVYLGDTDSAMLRGNVVRHNEDRGIALRNETATVAHDLIIDGNTLVDNGVAAIALQRMQATGAIRVTGNTVIGTRARPDIPGGDGVQVSVDGAATYEVDISGNTVDGSERNGLFYDGVGGTIVNNTITNNTKYGCLLQQSSADIRDNTWGGNTGGNSHNYSSPIELYGDLPVPIP